MSHRERKLEKRQVARLLTPTAYGQLRDASWKGWLVLGYTTTTPGEPNWESEAHVTSWKQVEATKNAYAAALKKRIPAAKLAFYLEDE